MVKRDWKGWMPLAIIFMILFLLETILIMVAYGVGIEAIQQDQTCAAICTAKYYDYPVNSSGIYKVQNDYCFCYIDNEITYTEKLD